MPKVSIITPAYNCEKYIEATVRSVIAQTEQDWEMLIVNDGSADRTLEIAKKLSEKEPRIKVHSQGHSGRPACPRNTALKMACGEYISFLDDDDLYHPERIRRAVEVLDSNAEIDVVFNITKKFSHDPEEINDLELIGGDKFYEIVKDYMEPLANNVYLCNKNYYVSLSIDICGITTPAITIRKKSVDMQKAQFAEEFWNCDDIDFWFQITKGGRVAYIREVLSYWRQRPTSISKNLSNWGWAMARAHERNLIRGLDIFSEKEVQKYREKIFYMYFTLGYGLFREGRKSEARRAYFNALRLWPARSTIFAILKTYIPHRVVKEYHKKK
jgi:glycosyltransferase involved in cell wall biosynthesis